jgi:hypothetical protein
VKGREISWEWAKRMRHRLGSRSLLFPQSPSTFATRPQLWSSHSCLWKSKDYQRVREHRCDCELVMFSTKKKRKGGGKLN